MSVVKKKQLRLNLAVNLIEKKLFPCRLVFRAIRRGGGGVNSFPSILSEGKDSYFTNVSVCVSCIPRQVRTH